MRFSWDERKRALNLTNHEVDFADAPKVFAGLTTTFEDDRFSYGEKRFVTLGFLQGVPSPSRTPSQKTRSASSHSDVQQAMKKQSSSKASKTNFRRLRSMKPEDVKLTAEHPELRVKEIARGIVRKGLKPVEPKTSVSLRIDADVLEWFKSQGEGYQTRMNAVLRAYKEAAA